MLATSNDLYSLNLVRGEVSNTLTVWVEIETINGVRFIDQNGVHRWPVQFGFAQDGHLSNAEPLELRSNHMWVVNEVVAYNQSSLGEPLMHFPLNSAPLAVGPGDIITMSVGYLTVSIT